MAGDPAAFAAGGMSAAGAPPAAGLVSLSTSPTAPSDVVEIDPALARFKRLRRNVKYVAGSHRRATDWPSAMFTFTHRAGEKPEPKDIARVIDNLRLWMRRKLHCSVFRYVWVAELQSARAQDGDEGAVHYHLIVWLPPELKRKANQLEARGGKFRASGVLPKPDKKGWWTKGSTERDWCRKSPVSYIAKYISKVGEHLTFPKGLRTYGVGGLDSNTRLSRSFINLPAWLRENSDASLRWRRAIGGGFVSLATGAHVASPWLVAASGRVIRLVRIGTLSHAEHISQALAAIFNPDKWRAPWQPGMAAPYCPVSAASA